MSTRIAIIAALHIVVLIASTSVIAGEGSLREAELQSGDVWITHGERVLLPHESLSPLMADEFDVPLGDTLGLPKIGWPGPNKTEPADFKLNIVLTLRRFQSSPRIGRALRRQPTEFVRRVDCIRHRSRSAFALAR
jgi:hypothetical protein